MAATADLLVRRHVVDARVVGGARVDEASLRAAMARGLEEALAGAVVTDGYWVLRRLDVATSVGGDWTSTRMSRSLAAEVVRAVTDVVTSTADPEVARWFPDRAAYLAQFLIDLADGRTGDRWEYSDLLARVRPSQAVADLARDEPDATLEALLDLDVRDLEVVVARLAADEAGTLAVWGSGDDVDARYVVAETLGRLVRDGRDLGPLVLAVHSVRDHGLPIAAVARACVAAADVVAASAPNADVIGALIDGRLADVAASAPAVAHWSDAARRRLGEALVSAPPGADTEWQQTPFGGLFLLAPIVEELCGWDDATGGWPDAGDVAAHRAARFACLVAAIGRGRTSAALHDPVIRDAFGISPDVDLVAWAHALTPRHRRTFLANRSVPDLPELNEATRPAAPFGHDAVLFGRLAAGALGALARALPGMAAATPEYLWRNVLDIGARVRIAEDEVVVELDQPPLGVLLSMTGLNSRTFVPAGEERRWVLTTRS